MKRNIYFICAVLFLSGCNKVVEQDFFRDPLLEVNCCQNQNISLDTAFITGSTTLMSYIADSLMLSIDRSGQDYMFCATDVYEDQIRGLFVRRGRAFNEMLDCLPVMDAYNNESGDLCSDLFSYTDGRIFVWNISRSLREGADSYDKIIQLKNDDDRFAFLSVYHVNDSIILVKNSKQVASQEHAVEEPRYELYSTKTGEFIRSYDVFRNVDVATGNPLYKSKSFPGNFDCIKEDRTKIAFGMGYMPVYGILDLISGEFHGFKIKELREFSTEVRYSHFCSLAADDQYIYALYYGYDLAEPFSERKPSRLFLIDWSGELLQSFSLNQYFIELKLNNGILYLINNEQVVYSVPTCRFNLN